MRKTMGTLMLGTALVAGLLGTGVANAAVPFHGNAERAVYRAAERGYVRGYDRGFGRPVVREYARPGFGVVVGGPVVEGYIPPCPGDGYIWLNGAWVFRGGYRGYGYGPVARFDVHRGFERGFDHGRGLERGRR